MRLYSYGSCCKNLRLSSQHAHKERSEEASRQEKRRLGLLADLQPCTGSSPAKPLWLPLLEPHGFRSEALLKVWNITMNLMFFFLVLNVLPVSPMYVFGGFLHDLRGISYITLHFFYPVPFCLWGVREIVVVCVWFYCCVFFHDPLCLFCFSPHVWCGHYVFVFVLSVFCFSIFLLFPRPGPHKLDGEGRGKCQHPPPEGHSKTPHTRRGVDLRKQLQIPREIPDLVCCLYDGPDSGTYSPTTRSCP